jgi:predicted enzyme related to lactoylglutathione lyase
VRGMALTAETVTIDCTDPKRLAEFWCAALGYEVEADFGGEYLRLRGKTGTPVALQRVPEPRVGKNRVHLDLQADDRTAEVSRLLGLGATVVAEHSVPGWGWSVLADPEGTVFCVGAAE